MHLVFNLSWLWALGGAFERTFGSLRWLLFVLLSAFVSSGIQLLSGSDGIGMSGVIYALFGFGWLVRTRYPEFARSLPPNTVQWFLGWGVLCIFLTYANILNVGNFAHLGGLLFGAALGAMVDWPKWRIPAAIGFVVLSGLSVVPIFWNPLSTSWLGVQAEKAFDRKDWPTAAHFYERALARASDESTEKWALINLVRIYRFREDTANFKRVADRLRQLDPSTAKEELDGE
jgi:GlpG protein